MLFQFWLLTDTSLIRTQRSTIDDTNPIFLSVVSETGKTNEYYIKIILSKDLQFENKI